MPSGAKGTVWKREAGGGTGAGEMLVRVMLPMRKHRENTGHREPPLAMFSFSSQHQLLPLVPWLSAFLP